MKLVDSAKKLENIRNDFEGSVSSRPLTLLLVNGDYILLS